MADLVGVGMVRDMAAFMTAIIVAGRSGAAYAAQLGTMKVTEEIDALRRALDAPERPVTAVVGGAKISTKISLLSNLVNKVDALIIGSIDER